jgi:hypothetical protein
LKVIIFVDMTVRLEHQKEVVKMMILVVGGVPVIAVVGGVWTDLKLNKTRSLILQEMMTG